MTAMHSKRHRLSVILVAVAVLSLGGTPSQAQDWPGRPVRMIVPYGPGGITDVIARLVADRFAKAFGQPFVVDNRGGAGGALGTASARAGRRRMATRSIWPAAHR